MVRHKYQIVQKESCLSSTAVSFSGEYHSPGGGEVVSIFIQDMGKQLSVVPQQCISDIGGPLDTA